MAALSSMVVRSRIRPRRVESLTIDAHALYVLASPKVAQTVRDEAMSRALRSCVHSLMNWLYSRLRGPHCG
jgi:hypothetical protein